MPIRDAKQPSIQFDKLGGLNQRPALNATPAPDFAVLQALYQRRAGSLQRLEGTRTLAQLPQSVAVVGGNQLDDGTGNVVVQGNNGTEYLFTLDELFGRSPVNTLVYLPLPDDNNMPTAIILQDVANGLGISTIGGATANTWYTRPLLTNPINESSIVVSLSGNQFELAAGTYRVRAYATLSCTMAVASGSAAFVGTVGFQTAIVDTTTSTTVATGTPELTTLGRAAVTGGYTFGPFNMKSWIDYTFTIAGPSNSFLELRNAFTATAASGGNSALVTGGAAAGVSTALNGAAVRQPYAMVTIAKIT